MTDYVYAEPKDAAEATARIDHWMGDLTEFQESLGKQPMGYYPKYSGKSCAGIFDEMLLFDEYYHRDDETGEPLPSLKDHWFIVAARTWFEIKDRIRKATDVKAHRTRLIKAAKGLADGIRNYLYERYFGWLARKNVEPRT